MVLRFRFVFCLFSLAVLLADSRELCAAGDEMISSALRKYCVDCHGNAHAEAEVNLEELLSDPASTAEDFKTWRTAIRMLDQKHMPPSDSPQPAPTERRQLMSALKQRLAQAAQKHAHDPGVVPLRRLTSAEYNYTIRDLTGLELNLRKELPGDAVGGEGFTNVGLVQFLQDSTLERYLKTAKIVASQAVIGAGPLTFYEAPGKTGLELSAIDRIQRIYRQHGFRIAAGEGGEAFGLERYPKAFLAAWRYQHRQQLGKPDATFASLAEEEGLDARFVKHVWSVLTMQSPKFPTSEIVSLWQQLPSPEVGNNEEPGIRKRCREIHQTMLGWQNRFGKNPFAKEEAPLLSADAFDVSRFQSFDMNLNWPQEGTTAAHIQMDVALANDTRQTDAVIIWKEPQLQFRMQDGTRTAFRPLREFLAPEMAAKLKFGQHPKGVTVKADDFVTDQAQSPVIVIPIPKDARSGRLIVDAELDVMHGPDRIVRCTIAQQEDTDQGKSVSGILVNPDHPGFESWKAGVLEFARLLPQVSHREPAPSDRDPIPQAFDNSYNNAERNHFHTRIKYFRDDAFLVEHILDNATREKLDQAWIDLLRSSNYFDETLRFLAKKHDRDFDDQPFQVLQPAAFDQWPEVPRVYLQELHREFRKGERALQTAQAGHIEDVLQFAQRAWRRPLTIAESDQLRTYYGQLRGELEQSHEQAIRTLLTRVLMAPDFLYHLEKPTGAGEVEPLSTWELASRLSYFLWSSLPDAELNRAAAAGELHDPQHLANQARRMLRDPKARRMAEEFFGQWFGFYRFEEFRGIDPKRFPELDANLKTALHAESVAFFEHIIRDNRPVNEILFADYSFLNQALANHYGMGEGVQLTSKMQRVDNAGRFQRGGLLGLGTIHAVTSAPLRTSAVKRGDWVLRRILGTPVPPPPADAGSIPADDALDDGLTVRQRLEAHRRDVSCQNCHSRIDPLGFALEQFDPIGRWREKYTDGNPIDTTGVLSDGAAIQGVEGLKDYLKANQKLFHRTLCTKLVGYALGRGESIYDVSLIEEMLADLPAEDRFASLVEHIVTSRAFRFQRGPSELPPSTSQPENPSEGKSPE